MQGMASKPVNGISGVPRRGDNAVLIAGSAAAIMLISLGAALLSFVEIGRGASIVGTMMVAAGMVELLAGTLRRDHRGWAMMPGAITVLAGGLFAVDPFGSFIPMVRLVIAWLAFRGVVLLLASVRTRGTVRRWTLIAAGTDLVLGGILLAGLSASAFAMALFGPTPDLVSSFAFVLALSFIATAMLLFEVAMLDGRS